MSGVDPDWVDNLKKSSAEKERQRVEGPPTPAREHSHYFKPCPYDEIDVYRVVQLFEVTDPCIGHAIKKLLVAGGRGVKDISREIQEAIDTLRRWQEMRDEEAARVPHAAQR